MIDINQILEKLPKCWDDISLAQFQTLTSTEIAEDDNDVFNGIENSLAVVAKLANVPVDDLEALPMIQIHKLGERLAFMTTPPEPAKTSKFKWKKIDEISYNDYVGFMQTQGNQVENLHIFLKSFSKTELTEEEILNIPITEAVTAWFFFAKQLRKSVNISIRQTMYQLAKQLVKMKVAHYKKKILNIRNKSGKQ